MSRESLAALTRGIHHAASSTYSMLAQQYIQMLSQFFEQKEDVDGNLKLFAKMAYIKINENTESAIPLISLVAPKGLALERMKVSMSVKIEETELKNATMDSDEMDIDRLAFKVSFSPRASKGENRSSDVTDIDMEFVANDPPEGVMRLIDAYTNILDPRNISNPDAHAGYAKFMKQFPPTSIKYSDHKEPEDKKSDTKNPE